MTDQVSASSFPIHSSPFLPCHTTTQPQSFQTKTWPAGFSKLVHFKMREKLGTSVDGRRECSSGDVF